MNRTGVEMLDDVVKDDRHHDAMKRAERKRGQEPEERVLSVKFGGRFRDYTRSVRRWL